MVERELTGRSIAGFFRAKYLQRRCLAAKQSDLCYGHPPLRERINMSVPNEISGNRRLFLKLLVLLGIGSPGLLASETARANDEDDLSVEGWPAMAYQVLGRTGFNGSRLVFGCGAALSRGQVNHVLEPAFRAGVNVFDVGYSDYYGDAEKNLGPFIKSRRDDLFVISKAPAADLDPEDTLTVQEAKDAARHWLRELDKSLSQLGTEHVDAYYLMAVNNTSLIKSEEIHDAFGKAKAAGKTTYFGISSHENAEGCLMAAAETGWYDLAQIAITPSGWYDWNNKRILEGSADMVSIRPVLDKARAAGIGLIGMKAGRHLAGRWYTGGGDPDVFDKHYNAKLMSAKLSEFQRSYAYVLEHGLDAVNADSQSFQMFAENFYATATSKTYFA
jgi:hypothetical protein